MIRRIPHRGLSLVEVVVAVALLGIGIAACVACVGSATLASQRAEEFTAVQLLAREQLAQIELRGANPGEDRGDFGAERPGFGWQTATTESDVPGLLQVSLTILWGNPEQPRRAEFVTQVRRPATGQHPTSSVCDGCHNGKPGGDSPDRAALGALGIASQKQAALPVGQSPHIRSGLFEVRLGQTTLALPAPHRG